MPMYLKRRVMPGGMAGGKAAGGFDIDAAMLAKINRFALAEMTAEDVYVRRFLMAHNMVDRDRERFPEDLLDDFAASAAGKSFLFAHDRRGEYLPMGLFFDASCEEMTPEQFTAMTGEPAKLPDSQSMVKVLWAWFYMARTNGHEDIIKNIEAGTYRHCSIGFAASDLTAVKGEFDQTLFYEYAAPGEMTEGSLVWLGAQQGATSQKNAGTGMKSENHNQEQGEKRMKHFIKMLGGLLGLTFDENVSEESLFDSVKKAFAQKDAEINTLKDEKTAMQAMADIGKRWQDVLVSEYVRMKTALGECAKEETAAASLKTFTESLPIEFLETEVKHLNARMAEKFPDEGQLKGDARRDKTKSLPGGVNNGKDDNPLIPE